jgi:hypothetical protein
MAWGGSNFYLGFSEGGDFVNLATAGEQFLGVKLIVKGQTHFGWARFSRVSVVKGERIPDITVVLDGYAYETTPNKPIIAGRMHSEDETSSLEAPNATATSQCISTPATLGLLAQGVSGLVAWRREDEV